MTSKRVLESMLLTPILATGVAQAETSGNSMNTGKEIPTYSCSEFSPQRDISPQFRVNHVFTPGSSYSRVFSEGGECESLSRPLKEVFGNDYISDLVERGCPFNDGIITSFTFDGKNATIGPLNQNPKLIGNNCAYPQTGVSYQEPQETRTIVRSPETREVSPERDKKVFTPENFYGIAMFFHPRTESSQPYVVQQTDSNEFQAKRLLYANSTNTLRLSKNEEDTLEDLTKRDISNLSYDAWSNAKLNEMAQPTRDSEFLKGEDIISHTPHELFMKGISSLEGRLCKDEETKYCIKKEDFVNATGISAVYENAAEQSLEDLSRINTKPFYGHLKGNMENGESSTQAWVISTVFPGDDYVAQSWTHYTGKVLEGEFNDEFKAAKEECSQYDYAKGIANCMDSRVSSIMDKIPGYGYKSSMEPSSVSMPNEPQSSTDVQTQSIQESVREYRGGN